MSGYAEEFNVLAGAFAAEWNGRIPVAWPNVVFSPPNPPAPWCRFTVLNAAASAMTIGSPGRNRVVHPGRAIIQFFAPRGSGEMAARQRADEAAEIFLKLALPGYRFFIPSISPAGPPMADVWHQVNMDCPFQRDGYYG
jgi:hypothetical protein